MNEITSNEKYTLDFVKQNSEGVEEYSGAQLNELFLSSGIECDGKFFVGLCFGLLLEEEKSKSMSYEKFTFIKYEIYNKIQKMFQTTKTGFLIKKERSCCSIIAVFLEEDREDFVEKYLLKVKSSIKAERGIDLHIGVGMPISNVKQLIMTYEASKYAYDLYFFDPKDIIVYMDIKRDHRLSFDEVYEQLLEEVYRAILAKDKNVYENIENVLQAIGSIHFGNRYATVNRCIMFIGELGKKLRDLNPIAANWRLEQEELQEKLRHQSTFHSVIEIVINFYKHLIPRIYHSVEKGNMYEIIEIKKYILKNYMKEITLKDMSDIMCVSPTYFSTFFKNATGKNFKTYLTEVRMEEALKLVLRSNMKTYEISEHVGYNNVRRFVDAFKSIYKMSPMEYRKVHGNEPHQKK